MKNLKESVKNENGFNEERHLQSLFLMLRKAENLVVVEEKTRFNGTELRLIGEVLAAMNMGKRLISTQLAQSLGVTRSAISQMVKALEDEGIVRRVPDAVDRKIAYIELTEETIELYSKDLQVYVEGMNKLVKKFGEARFIKMCSLFDEFCVLVEAQKAKKNNAKKCKREK